MTTLHLPTLFAAGLLAIPPAGTDELRTWSSATDRRAALSWSVTVANELRMA